MFNSILRALTFAKKNRIVSQVRLTQKMQLQSLEARCVPTTYTVTNANDSGTNSLRWAVDQANGNSGVDTIAFSISGGPATINLTTQITITDSVVVNGPGTASLIVRRDTSDYIRIFEINNSNASQISVSLVGFQIEDGLSQSAGGAIFVANEIVSLSDMDIHENSAQHGGAIAFSGSGSLTLVRTTLHYNTAGGVDEDPPGPHFGGAIYMPSGGGLNIIDSCIDYNHAHTFGASTSNGGGGAICFEGSINATGFLISNSTLAYNSATEGSGGAIMFGSFTGDILIRNSTVAQNSVGEADHSSPPEEKGGGLFLPISAAGYLLTIQSSIFAKNMAPQGKGDPDIESDIFVVSNPFVDMYIVGSNNFVGAEEGLLVGNDNIVGTVGNPADSGLDFNTGLNNNGGSTRTIALLSNSQCINAGKNVASLTFDQRGSPYYRNSGKGTDIGAFEFQNESSERGDGRNQTSQSIVFASVPDQMNGRRSLGFYLSESDNPTLRSQRYLYGQTIP